MKLATIVHTVFVSLFGLVFVSIGAGALYLSVEIATHESEVPWYLPAAFGLIFSGVGSFVVYKVLRTPREAALADETAKRYAGEPWRQVKEFRSNRIPDISAHGSAGIWVFALFWNGLVAVVFGIGWEGIMQETTKEPWVNNGELLRSSLRAHRCAAPTEF